MSAKVERISAPSGDRDADYFRARHDDCGWVDPAMYSNRTVEGRRLAQRNADEHRCPQPSNDDAMQAAQDALSHGAAEAEVAAWLVGSLDPTAVPSTPDHPTTTTSRSIR